MQDYIFAIIICLFRIFYATPVGPSSLAFIFGTYRGNPSVLEASAGTTGDMYNLTMNIARFF
jgi:hypothetical protein